MTLLLNQEVLLDQEIAKFSKKGWLVIHRTYDAVQLMRPKQWSKLLLTLGFLGLPFGGLGVVFLLLTTFDYAIQKEKLVYFSVWDIESGAVPRPKRRVSPFVVGVAVLLVGLVLLLGCLSFLIVPVVQGIQDGTIPLATPIP